MCFNQSKCEPMDIDGPENMKEFTFSKQGHHASPGLESVPREIFGQICRSLPPLWLLNLSQASEAMRTRLSFEYGNKIWYDVMPTCLWKESEFRQLPEIELPDPDTLANLVQQNIFRGSSIYSDPSSNVMSSQPSDFTGSSGSISMFSDQISLVHGDYVVPPHLFNINMAPFKIIASTRKRNRALGGPYQSYFDYKREILGYLEDHKRCFICLTERSSDGLPVKYWRWGILFCQECLREYTVSSGALRKIEQLYFVLPHLTLRPYGREPTGKTFYLPEIDDLLRSQEGTDVGTQLRARKQNSQKQEMQRLEKSAIEANRRTVRGLLVLAAKQLWEGHDPAPYEDRRPGTGELIGWIGRPHMSSSRTFEVFRERFAPTSKLQEFLFPAFALADKPTEVPYCTASGWMEDPTMTLRKRNDFINLTQRWFSDNAFEMLLKLTCWRHEHYDRKGFGGYVSNWTDAVKQYHIARLVGELRTGATVNMEYVPASLQSMGRYHRLRKLRSKCGLHDENGKMAPLPKRPERGGVISKISYNEYVSQDRLASAAEKKRAEGIKYFNKIMLRTCNGCPETALLFYPMGVEGLVEHMRVAHARTYWTDDDFHILG